MYPRRSWDGPVPSAAVAPVAAEIAVTAAPPRRAHDRLVEARRTLGDAAAGVAEAAHVDFNLALLDRTRRLGARGRARRTYGELDLRHTFDAAALGAHEMRMRARLVIARDRLEPPHVIADVGAAHEARFDEVGEVAVDRRAIPFLRGEPVGDVAV